MYMGSAKIYGARSNKKRDTGGFHFVGEFVYTALYLSITCIRKPLEFSGALYIVVMYRKGHLVFLSK